MKLAVKYQVKMIGLFAVMFILSQIPMFGLILLTELNKQRNLVFNLYESVSYLVIFGIVFYLVLALADRLQIIGNKGFLKPKDFTMIGISFAGMIAINMLGSLLIRQGGGETTINQMALNELFSGVPFIVAIAVVAIGAPFMEEIVFRGMIIKKIFAKYPRLGCVVSIIIFGFLHDPTNLGSAVIYFGMGSILAILYYLTDNIYTNITLHIFINFMSILVMYSGLS
ncbi:MAG: CPBP family intramembrane metalloprotease [Streptococcaceae bacterium]|jgi:membrane protease YdiL (CAAX protease family)|nr:CPBP family intramembrane metalloprotease [Streptococcaceae bacterium]